MSNHETKKGFSHEKIETSNFLMIVLILVTGAAGTKGTQDVAVADNLIAKIDEIAAIFWETKKA